MNLQLFRTATDVIRFRGKPMPQWEWDMLKEIIEEDND